ncbi:MAG: gamma-glutamyltransferase family protein [Planctomycetia bacterium]|nr:MAG: gamma-glutamyltransferase family protein [Planctomycetia bacterium]
MFSPDRPAGPPGVTRSEVFARRGMVATSQPLASAAALRVLQHGGSAADAAIAANAVLGVVEPTGCGIGGDLFAIVWDARSASLAGLCASGSAPAAATLDVVRSACPGSFIPDDGPLSVTVPGCVDGWFTLHQRYGRLPMRELLAPAIEHARDGFPVSEIIADHWAAGAARLGGQPGFSAVFLPGGRAPGKGDLFANPALADTLERIARGGCDEFYRGTIAERLDAFCRATGCLLRASDLAAHGSEWVQPWSTRYRDVEVWELPPAGQGVVALQMLRLLNGLNVRRMGHNSADYLHTLVEIKKLAYADRAAYIGGSPDSLALARAMLDDAYVAARRLELRADQAALRVAPGSLAARPGGASSAGLDQAAPAPPDRDPLSQGTDTVYLSVADGERNMVSLIQSNYRGFGSGLTPPELGFCLQNRGCQFSLHAGHVNTLAPGRRPFHTIIPAFVTRAGRPWLSFGVMGGDMQPQGHVQILCNLLDFGMNLQQAGDAQRFHHTGSSEPTGFEMTDGGRLRLESGIGTCVRDELAARGHRIDGGRGSFGGYQAVAWDAERDVLIGASESRKDGCAIGW